MRSLRLLRSGLRSFLACIAFMAFVTYFLAFAAYVECVALDGNHA